MSSTHPLQTPSRIGTTNLFNAPLNALEVAVLVPAALGASKVLQGLKTLSGGHFGELGDEISVSTKRSVSGSTRALDLA